MAERKKEKSGKTKRMAQRRKEKNIKRTKVV